jgi:creatinine amidohydrolase
MRLEELNWMDVEKYLEKDNRLMLVLGSCEQHGYLSLLTDTKVPLALADAASKQSGVLVAPTLNFGHSPYFLAYPGTISLKMSTYMQVIEDMIRSVYGYGFRRILLVNGHGGNEPVEARLDELVNELNGLELAWFSWWKAKEVKEIAEKHKIPLTHAGWLEAFPFTRVCDMPKTDKPLVETGDSILSAKKIREVVGDGNYGGPYQVEDAVMDDIFNVCLKITLKLLKFSGK